MINSARLRGLMFLSQQPAKRVTTVPQREGIVILEGEVPVLTLSPMEARQLGNDLLWSLFEWYKLTGERRKLEETEG